MDAAKIAAFKGKVVGGVMALTGRTFLLQLISFVATFILTILLSPSVFGIFFVVSAVISFLTYFSDVGLAAALIQKKSEPQRIELVSVFTFQQLIVVFLVIVAFAGTRLVSTFYKLSAEGIFLYHALVISFFLASLKTIPSILLERKLDFSRLVIPQILENLTFYSTAIVLAMMNMNVASFAWASLFRGLVGLISIYIISPWLPGLGFSYPAVKKLFTFGIPFQTNSLLALIKDDLMTMYLGKVLPFTAVGYLGWAKKWAEVPLRLIMDSVIRVTFPAFARIQEDRQFLKKAVNKTLLFLASFILPVSALLIIYIRPAIYLIPKYLKWQPALLAFYLFSASAILAAFSSPLVNALNALGKIKKSLLLMVIWTALTWALVPFLTALIGYNGWPVSSLLISSTVFLPIIFLKKYVDFSFWDKITRPLLATIIMVCFSLITLPFASNLLNLAILLAVSFGLYALIGWGFLKKEVKPYLPRFFKRS